MCHPHSHYLDVTLTSPCLCTYIQFHIPKKNYWSLGKKLVLYSLAFQCFPQLCLERKHQDSWEKNHQVFSSGTSVKVFMYILNHISLVNKGIYNMLPLYSEKKWVIPREARYLMLPTNGANPIKLVFTSFLLL